MEDLLDDPNSATTVADEQNDYAAEIAQVLKSIESSDENEPQEDFTSEDEQDDDSGDMAAGVAGAPPTYINHRIPQSLQKIRAFRQASQHRRTLQAE
jgi:hypothetical protein